MFIWNIIKDDEHYRFNISVRNYRKLKPIFRKTRLIPKIYKNMDFPFFFTSTEKERVFYWNYYM